jgi:hypothetical protein
MPQICQGIFYFSKKKDSTMEARQPAKMAKMKKAKKAETLQNTGFKNFFRKIQTQKFLKKIECKKF